MKILTNNRPRLLMSWYELTDKEKKEFDYLDTDDKQSEANFFKYRKWVYHLEEFMRCGDAFNGWDGYASDSYFSGVLVKYVKDDNDRIIVGLYLS